MQGTGIADIMVEADVCLRGTANTIFFWKGLLCNTASSYYVACRHVYPTLEGIC